MKKKKIKIKVKLPENAVITSNIGQNLTNEVIYEIDELEILEEVEFNPKKAKFNVKDGQYVNKGEVIFTDGLLGSKAMYSDFGGILEIKGNKCRILGQKRQVEKKINFNGKISRIIPNKYLVVCIEAYKVNPPIYFNKQRKITPITIFDSKEQIGESFMVFPSGDMTYYVKDTVYIDDLAKLTALGAKRVILNSIFIDDVKALFREINRLDSFAIVSGFGEMISPVLNIKEIKNDIFWGKSSIYFGDEVELAHNRIFEHPFWGAGGEVTEKNEIIGELNYNGQQIEVYLKNAEQTK